MLFIIRITLSGRHIQQATLWSFWLHCYYFLFAITRKETVAPSATLRGSFPPLVYETEIIT